MALEGGTTVAYVVLSGVKELMGAFQAIRAREVRATGVATGKALHLIERTAKGKLGKTSTTGGEKRLSNGRFAKRDRTGSAPGEPPFLRTGTLRRSVQVDGPEPTGPTSWKGEVGPTAIYSRIQELGGVAGRGVVLPARPYMQPAFDESLPEIATIYREAWAAALRG